jgi:peptide/nickel transport system substrate-binding protein
MSKKIMLFLIISCLSILFIGCAQSTDDNTANAASPANNTEVNSQQTADESSENNASNTLEDTPTVIRLEGSDTGLPNPFKHLTRGPGMSKMQILYDSLLEIDADGYIPWLAESYHIDETGKIFTFKLVENAKWHDGTPLTAEDVLFTFEYYKTHTPVVDNLNIDGTYIVESVVQSDAWTIDIHVSQVDNTNLSRLGGVRILPKHIWETVDDPIAYDAPDATIGSGPYYMTHYDPVKGEYRYEAFDAYWGPAPAVDAIEWLPVSDSILAFENSEISLVNVSADLLSRYEGDDAFVVRKLPSYHAYRLMMNMADMPALEAANVRQAMAYGIDREALVAKIARGAAEVSSMGYVPKTSKWYNPEIEAYAFDATHAKSLLDGQTYHFRLLTGNTPSEVKLAELIKLDLEKIGITVAIESVESKTRDEAIKTGDYELLLVNSGGMGGDPDYLRSIYGNASANTAALSASTLKGYHNETVAELAIEQAHTLDENRRMTLIHEMQSLIAADVPMIMLYTNQDNFVYRASEYDGWYARFDHSKLDHNKLSYVVTTP